ncbi:MAG: hypothetical protein JJE39_07085 [Vicinamibacteria bacterium]|nr:hypothetical protein [Vicinamibacteria bacterium]
MGRGRGTLDGTLESGAEFSTGLGGSLPVTDVRGHILTDAPWLAADTALGPWPDPTHVSAGRLDPPDERPLPPSVEAFLDAGEPPVYFGCGSIRAPQDLSRSMIEAARALGRRAILFRGWADLSLIDNAADCIAVGEINQQALFKRAAAVVHHGGAGTTTTATHAGTLDAFSVRRSARREADSIR